MLQNIVRHGHDLATLQFWISKVPNKLLGGTTMKPAIMLVFLIAIFLSILTVQKSNPSSSQIAPTVTGSTLPNESASMSSTQPEVLDPAADNPTVSPAVNSVKVESSIINGQANTNVEINGQKVDVPANGSVTQTTIQNGDQSTSNVIIHNNQTSNDGMSYGTSTSTSFSHSYDSTYVGGMH